MEEVDIILEEEEIISENQDGNIMELIKTESAEMNIQIYVLSVISLGHRYSLKSHRSSGFICFSCDGGLCCLLNLQKRTVKESFRGRSRHNKVSK